MITKGKMLQSFIKFSQLMNVFLSKFMQLELTKYCRAFNPRYSNDNTKCSSKQYTGR